MWLPLHTEKKTQGYEEGLRHLAIRKYTDGLNFLQTARHLGVSHTAVMNWVRDHANNFPEAQVPDDAYRVEMDEVYTFI